MFGFNGRSWLEIEEDRIRYSDVPLKGGPYVLPARVVEEVLPDLISMARAFEEIAGMEVV